MSLRIIRKLKGVGIGASLLASTLALAPAAHADSSTPVANCSTNYVWVGTFRNFLWPMNVTYYTPKSDLGRMDWYYTSAAAPFYMSGFGSGTTGEIGVFPTPHADVYVKCTPGLPIYYRSNL